jgi:hypothetical protein
MKRNLFAFNLLVSILVILFACKKIDHEPKSSDNTLEQKFFYTRVSSVPVVKAVTGFVYRQNQKYNFLQNLTNRIGFPYWNKALTFSGASTSGRTAGDSIDVIYIPFVRDRENFVNATLIVKITEVDTAFHILCDWQYKDFGFDAVDSDEWNASNIFHIFAKMDY